MFGHGGPVKVFVATRPVDFRKGIDGLARNICDRHPRHHALRRDPPPLRLRAPPPTTRALDHFQPGNSNTP